MNINSRLGATIYEFMSYLSASITARITEQVKSQLPQILPNKVYNFAHPVIKSMVTESLERAVLAKESSQPKSTYEAASSLTEFELKKILIDKMDESQLYLTATEHRECYDGLIKSYNLDKSLFSTYDKVYSLKRSRKDKDKDEDPSVGSDRGLKKRKNSKDAEPKKGTRTNYAELEYDFEECYKALSEKLDWVNPEGGDYPFDLTKPLPLVMNGNRQMVPVDYFFNNDLKYLRGGILTWRIPITKTKAIQYDLPGIEVMVRNIWSPVKVAYDKHVNKVFRLLQRAVNELLPGLTAQITNELCQNGNGGSGAQPPIIHTWLERFGKQKPRSFSSATILVDAENWIAHIEKLFEVLGCADEFKARLASYRLEGDALSWSEQQKYEREYHTIRQRDGEPRGKFMKRFLRLAGFLGKKAVANATRNIEILRERTGQNNKRNRDGDRIRSTTQGSSQRGYDQKRHDRRGYDRYGSSQREYDQKGYDGRSYDRQGGNGNQRSWHNRDQCYDDVSDSCVFKPLSVVHSTTLSVLEDLVLAFFGCYGEVLSRASCSGLWTPVPVSLAYGIASGGCSKCVLADSVALVDSGHEWGNWGQM
ncbi:hypothetical protein Tco_0393561 [Tanacetum coccineum]